jgi:hypothetical protein
VEEKATNTDQPTLSEIQLGLVLFFSNNLLLVPLISNLIVTIRPTADNRQNDDIMDYLIKAFGHINDNNPHPRGLS